MTDNGALSGGLSGEFNREAGVIPGLCPQLYHPKQRCLSAIEDLSFEKASALGEVRRPAIIKLSIWARGQVHAVTLNLI